MLQSGRLSLYFLAIAGLAAQPALAHEAGSGDPSPGDPCSIDGSHNRLETAERFADRLALAREQRGGRQSA
jgi:hypothetical protein